MPKITLLKKSKVVDSRGRNLDINDEILDRVVNASQATTRSTFPLVKGHPKQDDPQYGSVSFKSVKREGDAVVAELNVHDDSVAEEIKAKKYSYHSLKFSPATGAIYHVGILGAKLPAIPDLPPIELSGQDDESSVSVVELADGRMPVVGLMLRRMRDKMIEDGMTAEEADKIIPADELGSLESYQPEIPEYLYGEVDKLWSRMYEISSKLMELSASNSVQNQFQLSTNEEAETMTLEQLQAENARLKQQLEVQQVENAKLAQEREEAELSAFLESPEILRRITPAKKEQALLLLRSAGVDVVELSSGEGEEPTKISPREMLKKFIADLPPVVELGVGVEPSATAVSNKDEAEQMAEWANRRSRNKIS